MIQEEWTHLPNPIRKNLDYFYDKEVFNAERYTMYHNRLGQLLPPLCERIKARNYADEAIIEAINELYGRWAKTLLLRWLRDTHDTHAQELIAQGRALEIVWPKYNKFFYWIDEACLEGSPLYLVPNLMRFKQEKLTLENVVKSYQAFTGKYGGPSAKELGPADVKPEAGEVDMDFHDLTEREADFYTFFHNMRLFLEYKHTFPLCRCHTDVAQRIVRPMVTNHIITYHEAVSKEFIEALLGMICYELDPRVKDQVKNMREAMRPYLKDLRPREEE